MSTITAPVSLFTPKFLVILSTRRAICKDVLRLGVNPNCSSRSSQRSFTTCKILASRIFSNNFPVVSKRLMRPEEEGSAGSIPGLRIEITQECFQVRGKRWVRRTRLKIRARRETARLGRCFDTPFGTPFGHGALLTFGPQMPS